MELSGFNEEQIQANRYELVSRLADDLAHEIKNPLNAIVINLEVLRARIRKGAADAALERANVIEGEVQRLHQLVDRMLQLLRPDRDGQSSVAIDRVLEDLLPLVEAQARLARNAFAADCRAALVVAVPRDALKFALLNIITAVHDLLGEAGGTLIVECEADAADVRLHIGAARGDADRNVDGNVDRNEGRADGVATAVRIAGALLAGHGGRVEADTTGVTVRLPQATGP